MDERLEQILMQIIVYSGKAKNNYLLALRSCKERQFEKGRQLIQEAEIMLAKAHKTHLDLIQREVSGKHTESSLILMHAEDHLMSTNTIKELVKELLEIFERRDSDSQIRKSV